MYSAEIGNYSHENRPMRISYHDEELSFKIHNVTMKDSLDKLAPKRIYFFS